MMRIFAVLVLAATLAACTTVDIESVDNAPIGANAASADVGALIEEALEVRGWQVAARRPGAVDAFLVVRQHRADITVSYDSDSYSISYRDSQNLDYRDGKIHRNYNRWIANLNGDIQQVMARTRAY